MAQAQAVKRWAWIPGVAWAMLSIDGAIRQVQFYGYDYPVYWAKVNGATITDAAPWVYPERAAVFFGWLRGMDLYTGWTRMYAALVVSAGILTWRLFNGESWRRWPFLSVVAVAACFTGPGGGIAGSLRCANVDLVLAALALTPAGAVVASCVKPQLFVLVYLHAAVWAYRRGW